MAKTAATAFHPTESDIDDLVDAELEDMGMAPEAEEPDDSPADDPGDDPAVQPDEEEEDEEASPAADAAEDDEGAAPAGDGEDVEEAEVAAADVPSGPPPRVPVPGEKPFQFKAAKGVHTLAGAYELPDGSVVIESAALPDFRRVLASERELASQFPAVQRALKESRSEADRRVAEATALGSAMTAYVDELLKMDPDARFEALAELESSIPALRAEVREKQLAEREQRLAERERGPQPTPEEARAQVAETITGQMRTSYERLIADPDAKLLSRDEFNAVFQKHAKDPARLARQATADDPAQGIKKGDWLYDDGPIIEDLELLVTLKKRRTGPSAKQRNDQRNADRQPGNKIPPVVRPGQVPTTPRKQKAVPRGRDFKKAFLAGELDDSE